MKEIHQKNLKTIIELYIKRKDEIQRRLGEFGKIKDEQIFYELCFCLLTPGSKAKRCDSKVKLLAANDFMNSSFMPREHIRDIRFYNNKTENLLLAKKNYAVIVEKLETIKDDYALREWLVNNVRGFGYKEASHFLRNIGRGRSLAILDRHILKNLAELGVIDSIPEHLSKKQYLEIENKLINYSSVININPEELDLLLWAKETGEVFK